MSRISPLRQRFIDDMNLAGLVPGPNGLPISENSLGKVIFESGSIFERQCPDFVNLNNFAKIPPRTGGSCHAPKRGGRSYQPRAVRRAARRIRPGDAAARKHAVRELRDETRSLCDNLPARRQDSQVANLRSSGH